jgi:hypothetical protein
MLTSAKATAFVKFFKENIQAASAKSIARIRGQRVSVPADSRAEDLRPRS